MAEDALSFADLQTHVALQMGVAYYGAAGGETAQPVQDTPTKDRIKDFVNGGIRMFLNDAPPEGWRFQQPTASIRLWATSSSTANGAPLYVDPSSTVTVHTSTFYDSMVGHKLGFTVTSTADGAPTYNSTTKVSTVNVDDAIFAVGLVGQTVTFTATGNSYTIIGYTDTTTVVVDGDASSEADADTVTIVRYYVITSVTSVLVAVVTGDASSEADGATITVTADGNYTLPSTFGGEYLGQIAYTAGTLTGTFIGWDSEGNIRRFRENVSTQTGYPMKAAIRKMDATNVARRWELIVYPTPGETYTVEFPYELYFTVLSASTDLHPAGVHYDEAIKAACEAYAEMNGEDKLEGKLTYYEKKALPGAHRTNRRSAPRNLGSLRRQGRNLYHDDWRKHYHRPDVTIS